MVGAAAWGAARWSNEAAAFRALKRSGGWARAARFATKSTENSRTHALSRALVWAASRRTRSEEPNARSKPVLPPVSGTLSTTLDYTYVLRYTSLLRARLLFRPRCTSAYSVQAALHKRVCSGRRGNFGFFADGRGAAHEFGTTQDSVGPSSSRRLGEVVYQLRRRAFEHEAAAPFYHSRRTGRARRKRLRAGRRVHDWNTARN